MLVLTNDKGCWKENCYGAEVRKVSCPVSVTVIPDQNIFCSQFLNWDLWSEGNVKSMIFVPGNKSKGSESRKSSDNTSVLTKGGIQEKGQHPLAWRETYYREMHLGLLAVFHLFWVSSPTTILPKGSLLQGKYCIDGCDTEEMEIHISYFWDLVTIWLQCTKWPTV